MATISTWLRLPSAVRTSIYLRSTVMASASRSGPARAHLPSRSYATVEGAESSRLWSLSKHQPPAPSHEESGKDSQSVANDNPPAGNTGNERSQKQKDVKPSGRETADRRMTTRQRRGLRSAVPVAKTIKDERSLRKKQAHSRHPDQEPTHAGPEAQDLAWSSQEHILDLEAIKRTMPLPETHDYPTAPKWLFRFHDAATAIHNICSKPKRSLGAQVEYAQINDGQACQLQLSISGIGDHTAYGKGRHQSQAKHAAWLHVLSQMHSDGSLRALFEAPTEDVTAVPDGSRLLDVAYWKSTMPWPTRREYPNAQRQLFDQPLEFAGFFSQRCSKSQIPMRTDVEYSIVGAPPSSGCHQCDVRINLQDIFEGTGTGEGRTKQHAKSAAWTHIVAQMHADGSLKEIYGDLEKNVVDDDGGEVKITSVDQATMVAEKDAIVDIYNYAARLGQIPQFEIVQLNARPVRRKGKQPSRPFKVTIRLQDGSIQAVGASKLRRTAEIAAALEFKRIAETQAKRAEAPVADDRVEAFSTLNTATGRYFFDFLQEVKPWLRVEVEHTSSSRHGVNSNTAQVMIDDKLTGPAVSMPAKKQAEDAAYLTAAVELAREDPELLATFSQRLKKGKGKILKPAVSAELNLDFDVLQTMRKALVEAREAGLPDRREALEAADESADLGYRRQRRPLSVAEMEAASQSLSAAQKQFEEDPALAELRSKKAALPMNQYRSQVIDMISQHPYSIVIGATGSGKTTQVPQILLEDFISKGQGAACNVICTQPRRIAATSVAQRVAVERNEQLQQTVGYHVRFDAKPAKPGGGVTYCTTGILLEQLKHDADGVLDNISHIAIDEVHERDLNIDFLMVVLKKALAARHANGRSVPKVILMSATLDTELFAKYFSRTNDDGVTQAAPSLSVPGRTFPVQEKYLGDILTELQPYGQDLNRLLDEDRVSMEYVTDEQAFAAKHIRAAEGNVNDEPVIYWKREKQSLSESNDEDPVAMERQETRVPTSLLAATIAHICKTTQDDGAILAFLPGLDEILKTQRHLTDLRPFGLDFSDATKYRVCLLHSSVPKDEQDLVFQPSPPGCRKIILSTNIAETSVTVTDVKYVVDAGKLRELRYDQIKRISGLKCVWESRSNAKQRAGRAGRVSNGNYYALYSKERHDSLRAVGLPELLRTDLQETCLSIRQRFPADPVDSFLAQAIEPPSPRAVEAAIANLKAIEAFTEDEKLTALGVLLAKLPVHPTLGKMVVMGVVFRCLSPVLILGAAANERSLFVKPVGSEARSRADRERRAFENGDASDHMAVLSAFSHISETRDNYGMGRAMDRAFQSHIHMGAFRAIDQSARQIVQILEEGGLVERTRGHANKSSMYGPAELNRNSNNPTLIKSLLLSGLYPNLASKRSRGGQPWRTIDEDKALVHPSSTNDESKIKKAESKMRGGTLLTYSALALSNDGGSLFMRDTTVIHPMAAILFGGKLSLTQTGRLEMDEWLPFFVRASDLGYAGKMVLETRKALERVLAGAFQALAEVRPGKHALFANDPVRDRFANRMVEVLDLATGCNYFNAEDNWGPPRQAPIKMDGFTIRRH